MFKNFNGSANAAVTVIVVIGVAIILAIRVESNPEKDTETPILNIVNHNYGANYGNIGSSIGGDNNISTNYSCKGQEGVGKSLWFGTITSVIGSAIFSLINSFV